TVNDPYFAVFRRNFPQEESSDEVTASNSNWFWWLSLVGVALIGIFILKFRPEKKPDISPLSVKEREVFELLQKGLTNKEISEECNIELTTVKSHVSSIYSKLKIKSRKEAMDLKFE
ncbi:MAG: helix-turn-helix transcriptional regulator, partial [Bacteroidota bacterium]